jgi:DNA topoisomerase-6 subunit B
MAKKSKANPPPKPKMPAAKAKAPPAPAKPAAAKAAKAKAPEKKGPEKTAAKAPVVAAAPPPPPSEPPPAAEAEPKAAPKRRATAESMGAKQREISVSEFFTKNRHLLGFDNPAKALLTTVKEAVDNSLDACEEAGILPEIKVEITELAESRFRVAIEDNGPGIVKPQIPKIFAKLLYGSKFHRLRQSRGQQGIGISAAGLYAQLTTGKPVTITSKTGRGRPAFKIELRIDTKRNQPDVVKDETVEWEKDHGTRVEMDLVAAYRGGRTGVQEYLEQTVVANPHLGLTYKPPKGDALVFPRVSDDLPREPQEIKPHPHGIELGMLLNMLSDSPGKNVKQVLEDDFSRVSPAIAKQILDLAKISPKTRADSIIGEELDRLYKALGEVKVMAPSANSVVPIGEELLVKGLLRRFPKAEFSVSCTRPPSVYRGNPFVVEVGLAYGGDLPLDEPADVMRFANRVPLQYQPKACAISESVYDTNWKNYELAQPRGSLPIGPVAIAVHLASVWVPFTSEAKEAVAHYDDLLREMKLAIQECGRKLAAHLRARERANAEGKRRGIFERYIPEVSRALGALLGLEPDPIAKHFTTALPKFVNVGLIEKVETSTTRRDSAPPPPPSEPPPKLPPPPKGKGKKSKGKDDRQLSLM